MPAKTKPNILIVDDQESQTGIRSFLQGHGSGQVTVRHPDELEDADLKGKQLILVDFQLDNWPARDNLHTPSLKPVDGLALAAVLRRQISTGSCPTAIAIHTGKMPALAAPLPPEHREHVIARLNNLEWVFKKATPGQESTLAPQITSLAAAVCQLPSAWAAGLASESCTQLMPLLGLRGSGPLVHRVMEDVANCLPPVHELSEWSHGLAILRWFLHRVLPYPCFLWDTHRLAARLRLTVPELRRQIRPGTRVQKAFASCEYQGVLAGFLGPRWWRSKVESLLWTETDGTSSQPKAVRQWLNKVSGETFDGVPATDPPIVCIDADYQPLDELSTIDRAIRIRPDDWPPYADQAWTTRELAAEVPSLRALVVAEDIEKGTGPGPVRD